MYTFHLNIAVEGKIRAIDKELANICTSVSRVGDHHILDHVLATVSQLTRSLNAHLAEKEEVSSEFPIKDHFAPSQKNEKQLNFTRTTASAGRKKDLKLK